MGLRYKVYELGHGVRLVKTRTALLLSTLVLAVGGGGGLSFAFLSTTHADSAAVNFEPPTYTVGDINGQNGWSKTGAYDANVVANSYGYTSFGTQSLRISNAVTSGSFGDQTFAPQLAQPAGEPNALDKNGNPVASPLPHFEAQFDIASTTKTNQGMVMSVSPDNGSGARMSYLRFVDQTDGIHAFFDDATDPSHATNQDNFNESDVATLSYATSHTVKFLMDFYAGPDNDVVRIYVDGKLVKVGNSWEDYYLYDTESNPGLANHDSRVVSTLLFREGGTAVPANQGNGYLVDNLTMTSGSIPLSLPTSKDQCMNSGWKTFGNSFKNQGDCVSYVATKGKNQPTNQPTSASLTASGDVMLTSPTQHVAFTATDNGPSLSDQGTVTYANPSASLSYTANLSCVNVFGNTAYFSYVIPSGNAYAGTWVVWKVVDNGTSGDTAGFVVAPDQNSATASCEDGTTAVTNYPVTSGDINVQ